MVPQKKREKLPKVYFKRKLLPLLIMSTQTTPHQYSTIKVKCDKSVTTIININKSLWKPMRNMK